MKAVLLAIAVAAPLAATAQMKMDRHEGPSVAVQLGSNITLNQSSTLKRQWFVISDPASPVQLNGATGAAVIYRSGGRYSSGTYLYDMNWGVVTKQPLAAVQVRVHVFDVFGRLLDTLSTTEVHDIPERATFNAGWNLVSEATASVAFSSVVYVARARLANGTVYAIDANAVAKLIQQVSAQTTAAELEPKK